MKTDRQLHNALKSKLTEDITGSRFTVPLLLALQFGLHLLIYLNTRTFAGISESGTLFGTLDRILSGEHPKPLYGFYWYFTPSYIAAFFIRIFGSINAYFVFQCLLATLTSLLIYFTVVEISGSKKSGIVSIILTTVYTEYLLLSSVFYNQVYENFFVALLLLVIINFAGKRNIKELIIYGIIAVITVMFSLMFRNTLLVIFFYLLIAGLFFLIKRRPETGAGFLILSLGLFALVFVVKPLDYFREGKYHPQHAIEFWGHTPYGGNGGEVGFIYKENEDLFNERLNKYLQMNNINDATPSVVEEFKSHEVKRFITKEPHRWLFLQVKKVLYTFGIMPQRDGLTMLVTGKANLGWATAAILLQLPFLLIMTLFLLTVDIRPKHIYVLPGYKFLLYLLGLYLVSAISLYATWAERYRVVAMVAFIIPVIAVNIENVKKVFRRDNRHELITRVAFIALMVVIWGWQAYQALVIHSERYFEALGKIIQ
jgi:hypothetical protein